jgi:hypothetical protein
MSEVITSEDIAIEWEGVLRAAGYTRAFELSRSLNHLPFTPVIGPAVFKLELRSARYTIRKYLCQKHGD